jgi:hypothetical protein
MKKLFLALLFLPFAANAQTDSVLMVSNATVRNLIQQFTAQYTFPDIIVFVQDGNNNWIVGRQNLINLKYVATRSELKAFLTANGITQQQAQGINSLKDAFNKWAVKIAYVPPIQTN